MNNFLRMSDKLFDESRRGGEETSRREARELALALIEFGLWMRDGGGLGGVEGVAAAVLKGFLEADGVF